MQSPRYTLLAKQGFFTPAPLGEGAVEYTLTWKGMAASPMQSCIQFASGVREAEVLSHEKKRSENGVDVYEVVARAPPPVLSPGRRPRSSARPSATGSSTRCLSHSR